MTSKQLYEIVIEAGREWCGAVKEQSDIKILTKLGHVGLLILGLPLTPESGEFTGKMISFALRCAYNLGRANPYPQLEVWEAGDED